MQNIYFRRNLETLLPQTSTQFPALLVIGPRQVGKTTLLKHLSDGERTYVTLDDPKLAQLAREEPALFLQRFPAPILIDEIQYAPQLLPYIKMQVDNNRRNGDFWLTGSQQFTLMKGVSETLAGRVAIVNLLGFSLQELQQKQEPCGAFLPTTEQLTLRAQRYASYLSLKEVYQIIWRGAFPALWAETQGDNGASHVDRDLFYSSYVQTYLGRDIMNLIAIGNMDRFFKFLRAAAARTGQMLNIADMAKDVGVAPTTAGSWLSFLRATNIVYLLEPYHNNITKRLVKAPKLYFLDTGLCAYLTEWSTAETLEAGAMSGAILETFILTEILKSYWHNGKRAPLYYYRDKDKKEIDLLIVANETIYPIEFKKTAAPDKSDVQAFQVLQKLKKPIGFGGVICLADTLFPLTATTNAIPVGYL